MASTIIGDLVWRITGDTRDYDKKLADSFKKTKMFGDETEKTGKNMIAQWAKTALSIGGVILGLKKLVSTGKELVKLASDAEETANKFDVVFRAVTGASEAASDLAKNYGLAKEQSKNLLSSTADLLQGFGIAKDESLELSLNVQKLAVDLASFTNYAGGAEGASQALTKALLGERESVKQLGIAITDAELIRFAKDQGKIYSEMTKGEKAILTYELAVKQSANAMGDFARSQDSFANQSRIAQSAISDLKVALGEGLLPLSTSLQTMFGNIARKLADVVEQANLVKGALRAVGGEGEFKNFEESQKALQAEMDKTFISVVKSMDWLGRYREENAKSAREALRRADAEKLLATEIDGTWTSQAKLIYTYVGLEQALLEVVKAKERDRIATDRNLSNAEKERRRLDEEQANALRQAEEVRLQEEARIKLLEEEALAVQALSDARDASELLYLERLREADAYRAGAWLRDMQFQQELARVEEEVRQKKLDGYTESLQAASQYAQNVGAIFGNLIQIQMAGDEELTQEKKKNIIALYRVQQVANIAQIGIDTATAIVRQFKDLPFFAALATSAIIAGIGITQGIMVAKTPPPVALAEGGIVMPTPSGTPAVLGEGGQAEAVIPLDQLQSDRPILLTVDGAVLARWVQSQINNRSVVVPEGSVV